MQKKGRERMRWERVGDYRAWLEFNSLTAVAMEEETVLWILTVCSLLVGKSSFQFPRVGLGSSEESFCTRLSGMMVLKAQEKSGKNRRT